APISVAPDLTTRLPARLTVAPVQLAAVVDCRANVDAAAQTSSLPPLLMVVPLAKPPEDMNSPPPMIWVPIAVPPELTARPPRLLVASIVAVATPPERTISLPPTISVVADAVPPDSVSKAL